MSLAVLIVEDEIEFRNYLTHSIEWNRLGFHVVGAVRDVEPASALLRSRHIDLVLLDLTLQQSDGLSLMREVRDKAAPPRVIVITGHSEFEIVRNALRSGVDDYLLKPFAKQELMMSVLANREHVLKRDKGQRTRASLKTAMTTGWLNRLVHTDSSRETRYLIDLLAQHGVAVPSSPRLLLCCSVASKDVPEHAMARWRDQLLSMWKAAAEDLDAVSWIGFDRFIRLLIGGTEASELIWEVDDLATEFVRHAERRLPLSIRIGISEVDTGCDLAPLSMLCGQSERACTAARAEKPIVVWSPALGETKRPNNDGEAQLGPSSAPREPVGTLDYWFQAADRFVEKFHHDPSLDVQTVAAHLGISTEYLRRAYQACTGTSCIRAITTRRMKHAQALLASKSIRIAEVAERSGFKDPGYFARQFKRTVGLTPRQYRRSIADTALSSHGD